MLKSNEVEKLYWPQLDGLRSLAFFLVFLSHLDFPPLTVGIKQSQFWSAVYWLYIRIASWGWIGVELFFVLSAFLITSLLLKEYDRFKNVNFKSFMMRRILRIWPLYFFFNICGFILIPLSGIMRMHVGSEAWWRDIIHYFLPALVFMGNFCLIHYGTITIPIFLAIAWSVAMEEQFYIFIGLVLSNVFSRKKLWAGIILGFILTITSRWYFQMTGGYHNAYYYNTISHLDGFLTGMTLALLVNMGVFRASKASWSILLFFVPVAFYLYICEYWPIIQENSPVLVAGMFFIAIMCGFFLSSLIIDQSFFKRFFSHPLMVHTGRITYAMYLYHLFAMLLVNTFFFSRVSSYVNFENQIYLWLISAILSLLLTWLMAFVSWHLLEKHFYNMRYRFSRIYSGFGAEKLKAP